MKVTIRSLASFQKSQKQESVCFHGGNDQGPQWSHCSLFGNVEKQSWIAYKMPGLSCSLFTFAVWLQQKWVKSEQKRRGPAVWVHTSTAEASDFKITRSIRTALAITLVIEELIMAVATFMLQDTSWSPAGVRKVLWCTTVLFSSKVSQVDHPVQFARQDSVNLCLEVLVILYKL